MKKILSQEGEMRKEAEEASFRELKALRKQFKDFKGRCPFAEKEEFDGPLPEQRRLTKEERNSIERKHLRTIPDKSSVPVRRIVQTTRPTKRLERTSSTEFPTGKRQQGKAETQADVVRDVMFWARRFSSEHAIELSNLNEAESPAEKSMTERGRKNQSKRPTPNTKGLKGKTKRPLQVLPGKDALECTRRHHKAEAKRNKTRHSRLPMVDYPRPAWNTCCKLDPPQRPGCLPRTPLDGKRKSAHKARKLVKKPSWIRPTSVRQNRPCPTRILPRPRLQNKEVNFLLKTPLPAKPKRRSRTATSRAYPLVRANASSVLENSGGTKDMTFLEPEEISAIQSTPSSTSSVASLVEIVMIKTPGKAEMKKRPKEVKILPPSVLTDYTIEERDLDLDLQLERFYSAALSETELFKTVEIVSCKSPPAEKISEESFDLLIRAVSDVSGVSPRSRDHVKSSDVVYQKEVSQKLLRLLFPTVPERLSADDREFHFALDEFRESVKSFERVPLKICRRQWKLLKENFELETVFEEGEVDDEDEGDLQDFSEASASHPDEESLIASDDDEGYELDSIESPRTSEDEYESDWEEESPEASGCEIDSVESAEASADEYESDWEEESPEASPRHQFSARSFDFITTNRVSEESLCPPVPSMFQDSCNDFGLQVEESPEMSACQPESVSSLEIVMLKNPPTVKEPEEREGHPRRLVPYSSSDEDESDSESEEVSDCHSLMSTPPEIELEEPEGLTPSVSDNASVDGGSDFDLELIPEISVPMEIKAESRESDRTLCCMKSQTSPRQLPTVTCPSVPVNRDPALEVVCGLASNWWDNYDVGDFDIDSEVDDVEEIPDDDDMPVFHSHAWYTKASSLSPEVENGMTPCSEISDGPDDSLPVSDITDKSEEIPFDDDMPVFHSYLWYRNNTEASHEDDTRMTPCTEEISDGPDDSIPLSDITDKSEEIPFDDDMPVFHSYLWYRNNTEASHEDDTRVTSSTEEISERLEDYLPVPSVADNSGDTDSALHWKSRDGTNVSDSTPDSETPDAPVLKLNTATPDPPVLKLYSFKPEAPVLKLYSPQLQRRWHWDWERTVLPEDYSESCEQELSEVQDDSLDEISEFGEESCDEMSDYVPKSSEVEEITQTSLPEPGFVHRSEVISVKSSSLAKLSHSHDESGDTRFGFNCETKDRDSGPVGPSEVLCIQSMTEIISKVPPSSSEPFKMCPEPDVLWFNSPVGRVLAAVPAEQWRSNDGFSRNNFSKPMKAGDSPQIMDTTIVAFPQIPSPDLTQQQCEPPTSAQLSEPTPKARRGILARVRNAFKIRRDDVTDTVPQAESIPIPTLADIPKKGYLKRLFSRKEPKEIPAPKPEEPEIPATSATKKKGCFGGLCQGLRNCRNRRRVAPMAENDTVSPPYNPAPSNGYDTDY